MKFRGAHILVLAPAPEAPSIPETLRVVQHGENSLKLQWDPVSGARGFRLRWRPEGEWCPSGRPRLVGCGL